MELFVTVILLTVTGAQGSQLEGPQNTLSVVGSNVTLKCLSLSRNCTGIEWSKYIAGNPMTVLNHNGIISSAYKARYSVDNKFGCFLIIENVQLTDAGRFICRALISSNTVEKSAHLIILETQPTCTTNASKDDTVEEDGVQLNCMVTYNGTNKVSMAWKGVEDSSTAVKNEDQPKCIKFAPQNETGEVTYNGTNRTTINASLNGTVEGGREQLNCVVTYNETNTTPMGWIGVEKNGKTITRSYFVVASEPEVAAFTCFTSFAIQTKDDGATIIGLATNIPNTTCATSAIKVLFSVRNVILSPSGNFLNCTAKGQPLPTFKWQEMENDTWIDIRSQNGSGFTMTNVNSKWYRCVAMNVVRGRSYNATSHEFLVNNTDYKDRLATRTMSPFPLNSTTLPLNSTTLHLNSTTLHLNSTTLSTVMVYIRIAVAAAVGLHLLIILLIICVCVRVCPGYKCCHSEKKSKDNIREEQPLTENPDTCIYSVVNKKQDAHPKAKPSLASTSGSPKRPQGATTQAMPRTDNSKAGHANAYQHEEVTYAELAMEVGPHKVVPKYNAVPEETLYAAVGTA